MYLRPFVAVHDWYHSRSSQFLSSLCLLASSAEVEAATGAGAATTGAAEGAAEG